MEGIVTGWLDRPLIALDCEATSTDPATARVLSICIGLSIEPGKWQPTVLWVTPEDEVPEDVQKVHGLTREIVKANAAGMSRADALGRAAGLLDEAAGRGTPLVLHNARYDLTLLDREFRRELAYGLPGGLLVLDLLVLHRRLNRFTGSRRLEVLAAQNGIVFPSHDAEADSLATLRLLHILANQNELLPLVPVRDLMPLQARWYAEQQDAVESKALGNGTEFVRQDHWPIIPMGVES